MNYPVNAGNDHDSRNIQQMDRPFAFEAEINCLPMYIKRVLDRIALKIGRAQWLAMTSEEQHSIGQLRPATKEDCETARALVRAILHRYGSEPTVLPQSVERFADPPIEAPAEVIESAREVGVSLNQQRWSELNANQRYALTKLVDPAKKHKRKRALAEFLGGAH
jgi:hypothetical protein